MDRTTINQIEGVNVTLETVLGLAQTISDLIENDISLFNIYPSNDEGEKWRMKRLGSKLNALSSATITATEKAQQQIDLVVNELLKGGVNND
ncbi:MULTISPECIES: hypothetical protein [Lactobacillaceae]|uniref:Uncharacterized protein n=1 Tax=Limosilactobacillus caviae TaxID=1769424 RepID=A0ABQ2CA66_9LACO|nr:MULTISPECIES: hypothetical protein [Lactobacillaceae]ANU50900.1 hypothetical protein A4V07_00745 [Limosilactobacillus reuteri]MBW3349976.1 hypothetical protein [Limosilactobacillus reuteri]MCC4327630.1 hypothetical protein [Limosilactobacillus reuteri]MCC4335535.1 hypothetical protein [Limosilactobacillus reuteri]MCC4337664.1 hypothetical protein [Limosilactobacillus reuteri]